MLKIIALDDINNSFINWCVGVKLRIFVYPFIGVYDLSRRKDIWDLDKFFDDGSNLVVETAINQRRNPYKNIGVNWTIWQQRQDDAIQMMILRQ